MIPDRAAAGLWGNKAAFVAGVDGGGLLHRAGQPGEGWLGAWEGLWAWIRSNPPRWAPSPASRSVLNPDHRSCLPEAAVAGVKVPHGGPRTPSNPIPVCPQL